MYTVCRILPDVAYFYYISQNKCVKISAMANEATIKHGVKQWQMQTVSTKHAKCEDAAPQTIKAFSTWRWKTTSVLWYTDSIYTKPELWLWCFISKELELTTSVFIGAAIRLARITSVALVTFNVNRLKKCFSVLSVIYTLVKSSLALCFKR